MLNKKRIKILLTLVVVLNFPSLFAQVTCQDDSTTSWRILWDYDPAIVQRDTVLFFDIYKGVTENNISSLISSVNPYQREYRDSDIEPYTKYYYQVKARDVNNLSSNPSNIATSAIPLILNMDTIFFKNDTSIFLSDPRYVVDLDHSTSQYRNSLNWLVNDDISYQSTDQKLRVDINSTTDVATFTIADDFKGPEEVCFSVIDPDSFFYKKRTFIKYGITITPPDTNIVPPDTSDTTGTPGYDPAEEVIVYPVPFRGAIHDEIIFSNLPPSAMLIIYNVMGEPVYSKSNIPGPTFGWRVKNNSGKAVNAGLYLYYIKDSGENKLSSGKLVVVR